MWLAKKSSSFGRKLEQSSGGPVKTICARNGEEFAVGACEYRTLPVCSPYGIYTIPPQEKDLLILSAEGAEVCLGTVQTVAEPLQPGEILLRSAGGASIRLCNDGKILFNGKEMQ